MSLSLIVIVTSELFSVNTKLSVLMNLETFGVTPSNIILSLTFKLLLHFTYNKLESFVNFNDLSLRLI